MGNRQRTALSNICNISSHWWSSEHQKTAKLLIDYGSDVNYTPKHSYVPIDCALRHRDLGFMRYLLEAGANPDKFDSNGWTALHHAACIPEVDGGLEFVELLLSYGANPLAENSKGITPIDRAGKCNNTGIRDRLILSAVHNLK